MKLGYSCRRHAITGLMVISIAWLALSGASAQQPSDDVHRALGVARSATNDLTQLVDRFHRTRMLDQANVERAIDDATSSFGRSVETLPSARDRDIARGAYLNDLAEAYEALGEFERWHAAADMAVAIHAALSATRPNDMYFVSAYSVSRLSLAEAHRINGEFGDALDLLNDVSRAYGNVLESDPNDLEGLHGISLARLRVGKIRFAQRRHTEALTIFEDAVRFTEQLVVAQPNNTQYRYELFACYANIGFVNRTLGNHDRALPALEAAGNLIQSLLEVDPMNSVWQADHNLIEQTKAAVRAALDTDGDAL